MQERLVVRRSSFISSTRVDDMKCRREIFSVRTKLFRKVSLLRPRPRETSATVWIARRFRVIWALTSFVLIDAMRYSAELGSVRKLSFSFRIYIPIPWRIWRRQDLPGGSRAAIVTPYGTTSYRRTLSLSRGLCKLLVDLSPRLSVGSAAIYGRGGGGGIIGGSAVTEAVAATFPIRPASSDAPEIRRTVSRSREAAVATRLDFIVSLHDIDVMLWVWHCKYIYRQS